MANIKKEIAYVLIVAGIIILILAGISHGLEKDKGSLMISIVSGGAALAGGIIHLKRKEKQS